MSYKIYIDQVYVSHGDRIKYFEVSQRNIFDLDIPKHDVVEMWISEGELSNIVLNIKTFDGNIICIPYHSVLQYRRAE